MQALSKYSAIESLNKNLIIKLRQQRARLLSLWISYELRREVQVWDIGLGLVIYRYRKSHGVRELAYKEKTLCKEKGA